MGVHFRGENGVNLSDLASIAYSNSNHNIKFLELSHPHFENWRSARVLWSVVRTPIYTVQWEDDPNVGQSSTVATKP
jgi:hypothetical protein